MPFNQFTIDVASVQSRGIFNKYVYETADTMADVQAPGYFSASRFAISDGPNTNGDGWHGGVIECKCSDGYLIGVMDSETGTLSMAPQIYARPLYSYPIEIPDGLGWDKTNFPIRPSVVQSFGLAAQCGNVGFTPEQLFGLRSTALSAPFATFYVTQTGSDSNDGLSTGTAVRSIGKGIALANATGQPCKIIVAAGTYPRANNFSFNNNVLVSPAVDIAFVARNGRVNAGTYDSFSTPSLDATFTNCYKLTALGSCDRIVDRWNFDQFGDYVELRYVATPAIANATPNSWSFSGTDVYVNRADLVAVTNVNTRAYRSGTESFTMINQVSICLVGEDGASGFDMEGSNANGVVDVLITTPPGSVGCQVYSNCRFLQPGGRVNTVARAFSGNSFNGLIATFNCYFGGAQTDAANFHNTKGATKAMALTVNCTSLNTGRRGNQSCNALTYHEDVVGIDVCGNFTEAHGGAVRNIGTSKCLLAGTFVKNDRGDAVLGGGGAFQPAAVVVDDTANIWADTVKIDMPSGTKAWNTLSAGSSIFRRNCFPVGQPDAGPGTFLPY